MRFSQGFSLIEHKFEYSEFNGDVHFLVTRMIGRNLQNSIVEFTFSVFNRQVQPKNSKLSV